VETAIVILNWNGKQHLQTYLPSVVEHSNGATIWVADNASTDGSLDWVHATYPTVKTLTNTENFGFAEGYNQALSRIDADIYVLLNSDVEVTANWLNAPLALLEREPTAVGAHPRIRSHEQKDSFEYAGASGGFIDRWGFPFCRGRIFDALEKDTEQYTSEREVFWATGACLFIRAKAFHAAGGFDASFFAHMEEIDLCWRLKNQGHKLFVCPDSIVYHLGGGTLNYQSPRKTYLNFRNNLYMLYKNHRGSSLFFTIFFRMGLDAVGAMKLLFSDGFKHFWMVMKAHFSFYGQLGQLSKKRKLLKAKDNNRNTAGRYNKSIIWTYFAKGKKHFSDLDASDFD